MKIMKTEKQLKDIGKKVKKAPNFPEELYLDRENIFSDGSANLDTSFKDIESGHYVGIYKLIDVRIKTVEHGFE